VTATTTAPATTTATATAPTTTGTPTPTATTPPIGTWPTPGGTAFDPTVLLGELGKMGLPVPGTPAPAGDPLDAILKASAAKYAPGFAPVSPVGRAKLKQGEHAGMNFEMDAGKCYVVLGAGGPGVTTLGLNLLPAPPAPQFALATDQSHGNAPVIGEGKPLCPPIKSPVRVDSFVVQGGGDVAIQVWGK